MPKILKNNMIVILSATLLISIAVPLLAAKGREMVFLELFILLFGTQVVVNLFLGIFSIFRGSKDGRYYLLSVLILLLMGVPLCFGGAYLSSWMR